MVQKFNFILIIKGINLLINAVWKEDDPNVLKLYKILFLSLTQGNINVIDKWLEGLSQLIIKAPKRPACLACNILYESFKKEHLTNILTRDDVLNSLLQHLLSDDLRLRHESTQLLVIAMQISEKAIDYIAQQCVSILLSKHTNRVSGCSKLIEKVLEIKESIVEYFVKENIHVLLLGSLFGEEFNIVESMKELCFALRVIFNFILIYNFRD